MTHLVSLRLQHFRSYKDESFELDPGVNIIVGPNASGKTNLLEAILVACRGSSYRAGDDSLTMFNYPWARLETTDDNGQVRVVKIFQTAAKQFNINGQNLKRLSLNRTLPVVLFEPNNLSIVSGPPEQRRQYIDDILEQTRPGYGVIRRNYRRTLAQRNALLKRGFTRAPSQMFVWNVRLSELGASMVEARQGLVFELNRQATDLYRQLSRSRADLLLSYQTQISSDSYASDLLQKLEANEQQDVERGFTRYGPHRDDLELVINQHSLQQTASRGERRTATLVLKILEAQLVENRREQKPLLLLDDVFSELDGARRQALTRFIKPYQSFITTTDADVVVQHFTEAAHIIPLNLN